MAGLVAIKSGQRSRLFYRIHRYHRRKGERKGFAEADYAQLLRSAHHQLRAGRPDITEATRWAARNMTRPFTILGLIS